MSLSVYARRRRWAAVVCALAMRSSEVNDVHPIAIQHLARGKGVEGMRCGRRRRRHRWVLVVFGAVGLCLCCVCVVLWLAATMGCGVRQESYEQSYDTTNPTNPKEVNIGKEGTGRASERAPRLVFIQVPIQGQT